MGWGGRVTVQGTHRESSEMMGPHKGPQDKGNPKKAAERNPLGVGHGGVIPEGKAHPQALDETDDRYI